MRKKGGSVKDEVTMMNKALMEMEIKEELKDFMEAEEEEEEEIDRKEFRKREGQQS